MARQLLVYSLLFAMGTCWAQVAQGRIITGLERLSFAGETAEVAAASMPKVSEDVLDEGAAVFVDRDYHYEQVPDYLVGLEYVMLANDDKTNPDFKLKITLGQRATVYLFIDNRVGDENADNPATLGSVMPWVGDLGFVMEDTPIGVFEKASNPLYWDTVYRLEVEAGELLLEAQNNGGTRRMYGIAVDAPVLAASNPTPADGEQEVLLQTQLTWEPGLNSATYDLYLGTSVQDVNTASRSNSLGVMIRQDLDINQFDATGVLEFSGYYYWRVDSVDANDSIVMGSLWSFEVEPQGYPIASARITASASSEIAGSGAENTINGSGLNEYDEHSDKTVDMWQTDLLGVGEPVWIEYVFDKAYSLHEMSVWNYNFDIENFAGFGLREVKIETSMDGQNWSVFSNTVFAQGTSSPDYVANTTVDFQGIVSQYVRLSAISNYGTFNYYGLSEVRFTYIPTWTRMPDPANAETDVPADNVLAWRAGRQAQTHAVYISSDEQAVVDRTAPVESVMVNEFQSSNLELATTYYWAVDEINQAEAVPLWEGDVWNFTTQPYITIDDFESYKDTWNHFVFQAWRDGFGWDDPNGSSGASNDTGSAVGYWPPPTIEDVNTYDGNQSMPLTYGIDAKTLSETTHTLSKSQPVKHGIKTLSLQFYGVEDNVPGQLYVKINGSKVSDYPGSQEEMKRSAWHPWTIDLAAAGITSIETLTIGITGGNGKIYVDAIRLYP